MAFTTRLTKVGHGSEHFNERTGMCYHQTPPWERVVGHVRDAGQAKPHLEHNPLSLLGACYATSRRQLNDPGHHLSDGRKRDPYPCVAIDVQPMFEWSQVPLFLLDECPQLIQQTLGCVFHAKAATDSR